MAITLSINEGPTFRSGRDEDDGWDHYFYVVTLKRGTLGEDYDEIRTSWKQGTGITEDPSAEDVLSSMLLDASSYDNAQGFEDWASDYGWDPDSRRAERIYRDVARQTEDLKRFLGSDYDDTSTEDAEDAARRLVAA